MPTEILPAPPAESPAPAFEPTDEAEDYGRFSDVFVDEEDRSPSEPETAEDYGRFSDVFTEPDEPEPTPSPTPLPPPDEEEQPQGYGRFAPVFDSAPLSASALAETPPPVVNPRREEIRAPTAADQPALILHEIAQTTDKLFEPGQVSKPIVSPEVAAAGVGLFAGGARSAAKLLESMTGKPYEKAEAATEETLAEAVSGFTVPEQIAGLLSFAVPGVAETYAVNVLSKLPEQYGRLKEAVETHGLVSVETAKAATEAGITDLFGFLAGKAAPRVKLRQGSVFPKTAVESSETAPATTERVAPVVQPEARPRTGAQPISQTTQGGKPNALQIRSPAEQVPRPTGAGENLQEGGGGVRPIEQGEETARAGEQAPATPEVAPVVPKLRQGENQGDLLQGSDQPFNLAGEKGVDFEARQRAADRKAQEAEEARLKAESEQETLFEAEQVQTETGDELLDAVVKGGGLPAKSSPFRKGVLSGEIQRVDEAARNPHRTVTTSPNQLFRKGAKDIDELRDNLNSRGFNFETPADLLDAIETRISTGRKVYPNPPESVGQEQFGFGPGAASAKEPIAKYQPRKFAERFQEDESIAQEIRDMAGNRDYEPISNKTTIEEAAAVIETHGIARASNLIQDEASGLDFRLRSAIGEAIIKRLNEGHKNLKDRAPAEAEVLANKAADLAEWAGEYGTRLGQGVQAFAMWDRLSPDFKLLQVKRMVRKTRLRFKPDVDEIVDTINRTPADQRLSALRNLAKTNATARKVKPKFADIIKASEPQLLTEEGFYQATGDRLGLPTFGPKEAAEITRLAHEIEDAPEGIPREEAALRLNRYIAQMKGFDPKDVPLGIYYGNMLSGYNTQIVNALDTFLNVVSEVNGLAASNPKAAFRIYGGLLRGLAQGRSDALLALTEGRMVTDGKWLDFSKLMEIARFGEKGGVPIKTDSAFGRAIKAASESKLAYPLRGLKYVSRLMAASDAVMYRGAKEARISLLADRIGRAEGLSGNALSKRVADLLAQTPEQTADFQAQARAEGFTGNKLKARVFQLREMSRPESASADAADFAGEATYNHEPHGAGGYIANGIGKATNEYPIGKFVVPFTRIVANVTNRGLNYTPYGFKRAFWGYSREAAPMGDARAAMITRATVGTAGMTLAAAFLDVHGAGPSDPQRRKQLLDGGWKPYSIRIADRYVSYLTTPLGLGLSIIGNWKDVNRYHELSHQDGLRRATYTVSRIGNAIFAQSFLSGLGVLFRILSGDPGDVVSSFKSQLASTVGTFTTPRIITDLQRLWNPKVYRSEDLYADLLRNTPFAAVFGKPQLNAFGEPVKFQTNRFVSTVSTDPVWSFLLDKGLRVPVPDKYSEIPDGQGGKVRISAEQYYDFLAKAGPLVKDMIRTHLNEWRTLDTPKAQKELSDESEKIRASVKAEMFGAMPGKGSRADNPFSR